jgi:small GTP-binding protein
MKYVILGLSNVGKSSIFNYLCCQKNSIIYDEPDTTIDYISYNFANGVTITDTCGMHNMQSLSVVFSENYYRFSNIIIYVIDCRREDLEINRSIINRIIAKKEVWLVCNFFFAGVEINLPYNKIFYIDKNFHGIKELQASLNLVKINDESKMAVFVGASNVGKSSLFNCLVGFVRSKVKDEIGTTRDSVMEKVNEYSDVVFVDTAGFVNENEELDKIVSDARMKLIQKAYCLFIVIDGSAGFSKIDKYVLNFANQYGVFSILVVNKTDILRSDFKYRLSEVNVKIPIVYTSATKNNLNDFDEIFYKLFTKSQKSIENYIRPGYIRELNKVIKTIEVFDIHNKKFTLKTLKLIQTNPLIFVYDSYWQMSNNSQRTIKNVIRQQLKMVGFNIQLEQKKSFKHKSVV